MAVNTNWSSLKQAVTTSIKTNGNQEITGQILQDVILQLINGLGENATFRGIAYPETNPGVPAGPVFYVATTPGIYSNFAGLEVTTTAVILRYSNRVWEKLDTGLAIIAPEDQSDFVRKAQLSYYTCNSAASAAEKVIDAFPTDKGLISGVSIKVRMTYATRASTSNVMRFGPGGKVLPLFYNGTVARSSNTWADGEIIEIWTDGTFAYARKYDRPTVQTSWATGSEYTYIYSKKWVDGENNDKCVLAEGTCLEQHGGQLKMRNKFWGGSTSGGATYGIAVPVASSVADGAMSKEDKIFLDSLRQRFG